MWKAWNLMLMLMINWIMTTISRDLKKINLFGFKEQFYTIELSLLFCFVSSTLEQVLRRGIWTLFTEVSCGTLIILRSTSMKQNVEIVEGISHIPNISSDIWNLSNVLHQWDFQLSFCHPRRRLWATKTEEVLLIYFEQIVSFCINLLQYNLTPAILWKL